MICNGERINEIRFDHKGLNVAFRCILDDFEGNILPEKMMYIQFEDMSEAETLIRLLTEFKEQSKRRYIGDWRRCILSDVEHS